MRWTTRELAERSESEDRIAVVEHESALIVAVADGAGGMGGGGRAATLAIEALQTTTAEARPAALRSLLMAVDRIVYDDPAAGETTAVVASITNTGLVGASCGDSSMWMFSSSVAVNLTGEQRRKRIGSGRAEPIAFVRQVAPGSRLLIGSDGLFNYVRHLDLVNACEGEDLESAADQLVTLAHTPAGTLADDLAFTLVSLD